MTQKLLPTWIAEPTQEEVIGLAIGLSVAVVVLLSVAIFLWRRRHGDARQRALRLVAMAHAKQEEEERDEAARKYCAALELVCSGARDVAQMDEKLREYNASAPRAGALAFALPTKADEDQPQCSFLTVDFGEGGLASLGVQVDVPSRRVTVVAEGSSAASSGVAQGDELQLLSGRETRLEPGESFERMLKEPGTASFCRAPFANLGISPGGEAAAEESFKSVVVCSRCGTRNGVKSLTEFFTCLSCQATVLSWGLLYDELGTRSTSRDPGRLRSREPPPSPWMQAPDLFWECSDLESVPRHPTGCGRASVPPKGCRHHRQTGAQCGMAAVNNLTTNCSSAEVDAEYMMNISKMLGQAEAELRNGEACAQEQGEERPLAEFYATAGAEHFDVQTLQIAFDRHGFNMWYVNSESVAKRRPSEIFSHDGPGEFVGYVLHRKDKLTSWRDHWFVLRGHGAPLQPLLQDSLFDEVFVLTELEAHQLLASLPQGSTFAVSRQPGFEPSDGGDREQQGAAVHSVSPTPTPTVLGAAGSSDRPAKLPGQCPSDRSE